MPNGAPGDLFDRLAALREATAEDFRSAEVSEAIDRGLHEALLRTRERRRQQAKKAAAGAAVAMNDAAAVLAGATAVLGGIAAGLALTGVGAPAALGVA